MDIKDSLKVYHNFFEKKVASSQGIDKLGWRALQITTGIFCYPILGLVSSISNLASRILSKKSEENGPQKLEAKNIKHIDQKTQLAELKDKLETLPDTHQSEHLEELKKLDSTEEAEKTEMMKQAVLKQLRINDLNKKLDEALLEINNPLARFDEPDLERKIAELQQLKIDLQEEGVPSDEKIDQSIEEIKHQIEIKQLHQRLAQEYNGIVFNANNIFVAHLDEVQLKTKLNVLNGLKKEYERLNAPFDNLINPIIEELKDHIAFIQEVKKAIEIEDDGKALLNLGEEPNQQISEFRHDKSLMKLYREVQRYRQEKEINKNLKLSPEHRLKRSAAKAKFAYHLGIQTQSPSTGVHATFFLRSTTGKKLGVFKTADLRVNPIRGFFRQAGALINIGQELVLNKGKYVQLAGEKAAYIIKQKMDEFGPLDFELAPVALMSLANLSDNSEEIGAFLLFCKNVKLAEEVLTSLNKNVFDNQELIRCHAAFLYDFLLGNLDRHTRNYMMGVSKQDKIEKILLIDNSNILPIQEPSLLNHTANKARFVWKDLKVAQYPIPEEVRMIFTKILENPQDLVENIFNEINKDPEIVALFSADRLETPALQNQMKYFSDESKDAMKKRAVYLKDALKNSQASLQQIAAGFI